MIILSLQLYRGWKIRRISPDEVHIMKLFNKLSQIKNNSLPDVGLITTNTPFAIREAYKTLYTNLLYLNISDKCKKIAVTSAVPSEGKSTLSANLACSVAQNSDNKKVLLIDIDMRAPKANKLFGIQGRPHGLSEYLAGIDDQPNIIYLQDSKISILCSGACNVNPTKLIASDKMAALVSKLDAEYDYIIFDTPPVNIVTDSLLISDYVNGYIISTLAGHSDSKSIEQCVESINRVGGEIYGFVLSALKMKIMAGRYGKYSKYSKYLQ